ncbi:MAG: hypothetical protein AB7P50_17835 [Alphaproteobacteria bacterium]
MQNAARHAGPLTRASADAPYVVVNPGETLMQAIGRHRRDTGHQGFIIVAADNNRRPVCGARDAMRKLPRPRHGRRAHVPKLLAA